MAAKTAAPAPTLALALALALALGGAPLGAAMVVPPGTPEMPDMCCPVTCDVGAATCACEEDVMPGGCRCCLETFDDAGSVVPPGAVKETFYYDLGELLNGEVRYTFPEDTLLDWPEGPGLIYKALGDLVDENYEPLALSELYNHHGVMLQDPAYWWASDGSINSPQAVAQAGAAFADGASVIGGSCSALSFNVAVGAESRNTAGMQQPPTNMGWVFPPNATYGGNFHVIDLRSVDDVGECIMCSCPYMTENNSGRGEGNPGYVNSNFPGGGAQCCPNESRCGVTEELEPKQYYYRYTLIYYPDGAFPEDWENVVYTVQSLQVNREGGPIQQGYYPCYVEYDTPACDVPDPALDAVVPQPTVCSVSGPPTSSYANLYTFEEDTLVYSMWAHLHLGGLHMSAYKGTEAGDPDALVCRMQALYGNGGDTPGDAEGFLVDITACYFDPPLEFAKGDNVTVVSEYAASAAGDELTDVMLFPAPYLGAMAYWEMFSTPAPGKNFTKTFEPADTGPTEQQLPCLFTDRNWASQDLGPAAPVLAAFDELPTQTLQLQEDPLVQLQWAVDEQNQTLYGLLSVEAEGWIAIGFHNPGGEGMLDADIIQGTFVAEDLQEGKVYATQAMWSTTYGEPTVKPGIPGVPHAGLTACGTYQTEGTTYLSFGRPLEYPAAYGPNYANITAGPNNMIYAFGSSNAFQYHGPNRGTRSVTWFS